MVVWCVAAAAAGAWAAEPVLPPAGSAVTLPVYVCDAGNPQAFSLFANGGWDGNWYVGYNTCWVQELILPERGDIVRAYIGAKLGRMKSAPAAGGKPWEQEPLPGEIYMAVASTPSWKAADTVLLTSTAEIPLAGDSQNAISHVGESRWFWHEVPLENMTFGAAMYCALWSPSENLADASSAPILAAAWGDIAQDTWLADNIAGAPPHTQAEALGTPITYFDPAIAIKLVPRNEYRVSVGMTLAKTQQVQSLPRERKAVKKRDSRADRSAVVAEDRVVQVTHDRLTISAFVIGVNIERVWLEYSRRGANDWQVLGRPVWSPPFQMVLDKDTAPLNGSYDIRVAASDELGNTGVSARVRVTTHQPRAPEESFVLTLPNYEP